ncbi:hypothetical protein [Streptomyces hirsutus]|nr:hypothetical protein [Streptomyces hirsutus]
MSRPMPGAAHRGHPIPASSIAEGFPELTTEQGEAATRVVTMLPGALEAH